MSWIRVQPLDRAGRMEKFGDELQLACRRGNDNYSDSLLP